MTDFAAAARALAGRVGNMLARGRVRSVNAGTRMQTLQLDLLEGETKDRLEHFEAYGFTSHPKAGAEAAVVFLDGDRSHGLVLVVADRRYRLRGLADGEVALHDDGEEAGGGSSIVLKRGGVIEITAAAAVHLNTPELLHNGVNVGATHRHGGVQAGGANTGTPT